MPLSPNSNLLSPIDADDNKSVTSSSFALSPNSLNATNNNDKMNNLPTDVIMKLASGPVSERSSRLWSTCIASVPQVVLITAVDDNGNETALPANHDRSLACVIRDAVERVGTVDLKRVSAASFLLTYTIPKEGIFEMETTLFGMPVSNSPFVIRCYPFGSNINQMTSTSPSVNSIHSATSHSKLHTSTPKHNVKAVVDSGLRRNSPLRTLNDKNNSTTSTTSTALKQRIVTRNYTPSPSLRGKTNSVIDRSQQLSRVRSKSAKGVRHSVDCPSHHHATLSSRLSNQSSVDSRQSSSKTPRKEAEMDQLKNFCKKVVMLTSGDTHNHQDEAEAFSHPSHMDDFLFSFGNKGRGKGEFSNIQDVCVTADGRLVISDSGNQNVQVFSSTGEFRFRFGVPGRNPGQMARPTGLAVSEDDDRFYVADYENRCVHVYNDDGRHLGRLGVGRLLGPKGVCLVPGTNLLVVVDNRASEVFIFDVKSHKMRSKFGCRGSQPHQLAGPHFAAILDNKFCSTVTTMSSKPRIAVTDFHNHAVKAFDLDGNLQHVFGNGLGEGPGQFNAVTGLAVDNTDGGTLYIADWGNSRIEVFNGGGTFRGFVNCLSAPALFGPQGMAVDGNKMRLIAADSGNHCVKVFRTASQTTCYV